MKRLLSYSAKLYLKKILRITALVLVVLILLIAGRFIYVQRFLVYDENGVHLEYSSQISTKPADSENLPDGEFILEQEEVRSETIETPIVGELPVLSGLYLTASQLLDEETRTAAANLPDTVNAVMLDVKTATGKFLYTTSLPGTDCTDTDLTGFITDLAKRSNLTLIARLPAFRDNAHALMDFSQALPIRGGALWMDASGSYWLDPAGSDVPSYLIEQARELFSLGFDEIVFDDFGFPNSVNIVYESSIAGSDAVLAAAQTVSQQLEAYNIPVSFVSSDSEVTKLSARAFIPAETGDLVSQTAKDYSLLLPGSNARLVFLTPSRDTRFENYSVLSPFVTE